MGVGVLDVGFGGGGTRLGARLGRRRVDAVPDGWLEEEGRAVMN